MNYVPIATYYIPVIVYNNKQRQLHIIYQLVYDNKQKTITYTN